MKFFDIFKKAERISLVPLELEEEYNNAKIKKQAADFRFHDVKGAYTQPNVVEVFLKELKKGPKHG